MIRGKTSKLLCGVSPRTADTKMALENITLKQLDSQETFPAKDLLKNGKPLLVLAVRRPGCLLCREEAGELSAFRDIIAKCGVNMVAVVKEELGTKEFRSKFWSDPVFLDPDWSFYAYFGGGKPKSASLLNVLMPSFWLSIRRANVSGYEGDLAGEGLVLGGLAIFDASGKPVYEYPEKTWGDHAPIMDVINACKQLAPADVRAELDKEGLDLTKLRKAPQCDAQACKL